MTSEHSLCGRKLLSMSDGAERPCVRMRVRAQRFWQVSIVLQSRGIRAGRAPNIRLRPMANNSQYQ